MIGQVELVNKFNSYSLSTLPHSILFEGEFGCGKHLFVKELANRFKVETEDITDNLNYEYISTLLVRTLPMFYVVNGVELSLKAQNALLKFLEEPTNSCYIFVLCNSKNELLDTIQNRCSCFKFQPYSREELEQFTNNEILLEYANTPGQVLEFNKINLTEALTLCDTILQKIDGASIPNVLTLSSKFDFGKEPSKFNIELFCKLLLKKAFQYVIINDNEKYIGAYKVISNLVNELKIPTVDKKKLFELKLLDLKFKLK